MRIIWKRLLGKLDEFSIFLKSALLFELVMVLSIIAVTVFVTGKFSAVLKNKEIDIGNTKVEKMLSYTNEKYNRIYSLVNYIHSSDLSRMMSEIASDSTKGYEYKNIAATDSFFSATSSSDSDISDIIFVSTNGVIYTYTSNDYSKIKTSYSFMDNDIIRDFLISEDSQKIFYADPSEYTLKPRDPVVSFLGKIYDSSLYPKKKVVGICIFNIPIDKFENAIDWTYENSEGKLMLLNKYGQILYSTSDDLIGTGTSFSEMENNKEWYYNSSTAGSSGMKVIYILKNSLLLENINQMKGTIALVLLIAIGTTIFVNFIVYKIFNGRVRTLMNYMRQVQQGNLQLRVPVKSQDEIGILGQSFNQMCEKLEEHIALEYRAGIELKNAEISALQAQIDPHFLYNTLDSIKAKALSEHSEGTAEMIVLLAKLFRWSSRTKDKLVSLEEELDYIRTYLKLQSYRYREELDIDINISDEYLDYAIPKLILQPVVENIIKHAFTDQERPGIVSITARVKVEENQKKSLDITICDNGIGMTEETLIRVKNKLNENDAQDEFDSIGIQNVHHRLRLLFGDKYGLSIQSIQEFGTAVKISIPAMTVEEMGNIV